METIQDLIEEAKVRTVWCGLCIFSVTYFLTHTSKSMWMNLPMAILILCGVRILLNQIEFRWKVRPAPKSQLSLNDARLSTTPPPPRWKKKIDSPVVEAEMNDVIDKILNDFVINQWYSSITPDREFPELIRGVIMDALGEISVRVKEINLVDLLTRDIVYLIGDHLESFRRNHAAIGTDFVNPLSPEEIDERLKFHLMASGELYPALVSPESEYKVVQKIVAGILSVVMLHDPPQSLLDRTILREIVTRLGVQPLLNLASSERINEMIETIINLTKKGNFEQFSVMEHLAAVNVDDVMDDIVRKIKVVSDVFMRKIKVVSSGLRSPLEENDNAPACHLFWSWMPPNANASVPILNLVDKVFQLNRSGLVRRPFFWMSKQIVQLVMKYAGDDRILGVICWLRNEDTVVRGIRWAQDILWPNGVFFTRVSDGQEASDGTDPSEKTFVAGQLGGMKVDKPSSSEQQLEAARRAREIYKFLVDDPPTALVILVRKELYMECARDIFYFTQSNVCIKQLTFAILELLLRTVFPELQDLLRDIRENDER